MEGLTMELFFFFWSFETGFLCILAVLVEICLPLPPLGLKVHCAITHLAKVRFVCMTEYIRHL